MRTLFASLPLLLAALSPAAQARDVDVSLSLGFVQPGLVGRVDIGRPLPVYAAPVYVAPQPVYLAPQPVYVMKPYPRKRGHDKRWRRACERYGDCGYAAYAPAPAYRYGPPVVVYRD